MAEHREPVRLKINDNFVTELRRNMGDIRRAAADFDPGRRRDAELIAKIDGLPDGDPEIAHSMLDSLLETQFPADVREAIQRLKDRCAWWASS